MLEINQAHELVEVEYNQLQAEIELREAKISTLTSEIAELKARFKEVGDVLTKLERLIQ